MHNRHFDIPRVSTSASPLPRPDPPAGSIAPRRSDIPLARPIAQSPVIWSLKRPAHSDSPSIESILSPESPKIPRIHNAPSELSPALPGPKRSSNTQMIQVRQCSTNDMLMQKWFSLLRRVGDCSDVWLLLQKSPHWKEHAGRILDGSAPSTALKYIQLV